MKRLNPQVTGRFQRALASGMHLWCAVIATALGAGCGTPPATEPPASAQERVLECDSSSTQTPLPPDARAERYYPQAMETLLAKDEALRRDYGSTSVETCEDARRFMAAYLPQADRIATEATPEDVGQPDPRSLPVEVQGQVVNGLDGILAPVVMWNFNPYQAGDGPFCTGVIISARHFLTSAHCVPTNGWRLVSFARQVTKGVYPEGMYPAPIWVYFTKHPSYVGNDPTYDLAVGSLYYETFPYDAMMRVWLGSVSYGQDIYYWGYGRTDPSDYYSGGQHLHMGSGTLYSVSTYWFSSIPNTSPARPICNGDSGGAQVRYHAWEMLYGINSRGDCAVWSYATRLRYHMPWIESTMGTTCTRYSYNGEPYARCW